MAQQVAAAPFRYHRSLLARCQREYGWTATRARDLARAYQQFMLLKKREGDMHATVLSPPPLIDHVWHQHILDVADYVDACNAFCGGLIGHDPDGMLDERARAERRSATRAAVLRAHLADAEVIAALWNFGDDNEDEPMDGPPAPAPAAAAAAVDAAAPAAAAVDVVPVPAAAAAAVAPAAAAPAAAAPAAQRPAPPAVAPPPYASRSRSSQPPSPNNRRRRRDQGADGDAGSDVEVKEEQPPRRRARRAAPASYLAAAAAEARLRAAARNRPRRGTPTRVQPPRAAAAAAAAGAQRPRAAAAQAGGGRPLPGGIAAGPGVTVFVKALNGRVVRITVPSLRTKMADVAAQYEELIGIPVEQQRFVLRGRQVWGTYADSDNGVRSPQTMADCGIAANDHLDMIMPLRGC